MIPDHLIADITCKALIQRDGKFLIVQESDEQWALPGGRMNVGEEPRVALEREVMEELGLEIEVGDVVDCTVFTSKSGMHHFIIVFRASTSNADTEIKIDKTEVVDYRWVDTKEATTMRVRDEYRSFITVVS